MESIPSIELAVSLFGFLTWYLGVYRTVEEETNQCINRIEYLIENAKYIPKDRDLLNKAILANRSPLETFEKRWFRLGIIWAPVIFTVFTASVSLITGGLPSPWLNLALIEYGAIMVKFCLIVTGFIIFLSIFVLAYAFKDHPEAQYLEVFFLILNEKMKTDN